MLVPLQGCHKLPKRPLSTIIRDLFSKLLSNKLVNPYGVEAVCNMLTVSYQLSIIPLCLLSFFGFIMGQDVIFPHSRAGMQPLRSLYSDVCKNPRAS